jgi:hypothetical protein
MYALCAFDRAQRARDHSIAYAINLLLRARLLAYRTVYERFATQRNVQGVA